MVRTNGYVSTIISFSLAGMLYATAARAEDAAAKRRHRKTTTTVTERYEYTPATPQRQIEQLRGEVRNLRRMQSEQAAGMQQSIQKLQQEVKVAPPATETAPPQTIGEHVSVVEKDVGDIKKNL